MVFDYAKQFYKESEYPALAWQARVWSSQSSRPLAGIKILDATPVFRNTVLKYATLIAAGTDLTVGISDVMPYDADIVKRLRESGVKVVHANDRPTEQDIILDCAGSFSKWPARYGVSELTRSGAYVYENAGLPVFLADEGHIKRIETCLGTGDGFIRAMEQLGYTEWNNRRIVVFGSGKVGTGIIYRAVKSGAIVDVVTDPATLSPFVKSIINSCTDYRIPTDVAQILEGAYAIVTATGHKGAVGKYLTQSRDVATIQRAETSCLSSLLASNTLLVNMGVEDEFGDLIPESAALNGKHPLNFILEEPTQMKYIDATMALHNHGALFLLGASGSQITAGIITPPEETETAILDITKQNGLISEELDLIYNMDHLQKYVFKVIILPLHKYQKR